MRFIKRWKTVAQIKIQSSLLTFQQLKYFPESLYLKICSSKFVCHSRTVGKNLLVFYFQPAQNQEWQHFFSDFRTFYVSAFVKTSPFVASVFQQFFSAALEIHSNCSSRGFECLMIKAENCGNLYYNQICEILLTTST